MKWLIAIAACIAAVLLLALLIGMTLPTAHTASKRARFRQPPQVLFAVLAGPPGWRPDVTRVEKMEPVDGRERWTEFDSHGKGVLCELVESAPPLRRSVRIADPTLPYGGTWTFEIVPLQGGSLLRITEHGEVRNPLFRFLSKYVIGQTRSIDAFLQALARKFNESIVIEEEGKPWDKRLPATPG